MRQQRPAVSVDRLIGTAARAFLPPWVPSLALLWVQLWIPGLLLLAASLLYVQLARWRRQRRQSFAWSRQLILITGGSNGVGRSLIPALRRRGHTFSIVSLDVEDAGDLRDLPNFEHINCDISDLAQIERAKSQIVNKYGVPTVLINNAAIVQGKYLTELTPEQIKRTIDVNLMGPIWVTKTFLPLMIDANCGHIISVASAAGLTGLAWLSDYCASKFGLYGFHESLRQELLHTAIRSSIVCPAHIGTRLFKSVRLKYPFLTPSLDPADVAERIVCLIEDNVSRDLWLPLFTHASLLVRAAPIWLNDFGHWLMATNDFLPPEQAPTYNQGNAAATMAQLVTKNV